MKYILIFSSIILFSCSEKKEDELLRKYPLFKNVVIYKKDNTATLNNFELNSKKKGLEYLVDLDGNLIEMKNYSNGLKNGLVIHYSKNSKPHIVAHYINDTLSGNFFELDTIGGHITFWSEKLPKHGRVYDNHYVSFSNGKIDLNRSSFQKIQKINDSIVLLSIPCKYPFPNTKVVFVESDKEDYEYTGNETETKSSDGVNYFYKIKDSKEKYILGNIIYSKSPKDENDESVSGRIIYFKLQINQNTKHIF